MSSENNKSIIKKTQELLQDYGHSVKTGHLYELFSKLANEASWNVAKSKQVSFLDKVVNLATRESLTQGPMGQAKVMYEESLKNNFQSHEITLGMLLSQDGKPAQLLNKNMEIEPNALFVGSMGSGKTIAMSITLFNYIQKNPDQTLAFIIDPLKGAKDYEALFTLPKVFPVINSTLGIHRIITLVYDEALARRDAFVSIKAENISDYEQKTGKKMDRIILAMEEFNSIPFQILNFSEEYKIPGTSANKFHQLMRIGRSLGIWFLAASQKATKSDIPVELLPNFTQKQVFRVSKSEASYLLSDTKAGDIRPDQKGLCETGYGTVQFPFVSVDEQIKEVKNIKQDKFYSLILTSQLINSFLSTDTDKIYYLRKLSDYVKEIKHYDLQLVFKRLHEDMGHKVELVNQQIDTYGLAMLVEVPNKGRIAVMGNEKISAKHINSLKKGMEINKCEQGIIYCLDKDISAEIYKWAIENQIEVVDYEDLLRLALSTEQK